MYIQYMAAYIAMDNYYSLRTRRGQWSLLVLVLGAWGRLGERVVRAGVTKNSYDGLLISGAD